MTEERLAGLKIESELKALYEDREKLRAIRAAFGELSQEQVACLVYTIRGITLMFSTEERERIVAAVEALAVGL